MINQKAIDEKLLEKKKTGQMKNQDWIQNEIDSRLS